MMDFISHLPHTFRSSYGICVNVDRLTKSTHFIPIQMSLSAKRLARINVSDIVHLHGVPVSTISYSG